jgi:hypothetical protein
MRRCPPAQALERLLAEGLSGAERGALEAHVEGCPACQEALARLAGGADPCGGWPTPPGEATSSGRPDPAFLDRVKQALARDGLGAGAAPSEAGGDSTQQDGGRAGASADWPAVPGYEVLAELGRGGMGVVYQARQTGLGRLVALKTVRAGARASPEELARFQREAEAVARLRHPHIVQVFDVGAAGGRPYLVLEYVEGGNLARRLAGTPLSARAAAELAQTLARAVEHAHGQHILHRDLKPANVLLTADGVAKVTDFGLAKLLPGAGEDARAEGQTQSGAVLGTPSYMAPEQAGGRSKEVGPAADVYALGAILYELLTGRPPFKAETPLETLQQVLTEEPVPVRRLQPKVPRDLETICLKCLEKEPARRYPSALALAEDLQRFLGGEPIRARPSTLWEKARKWARRKPAAATLVGVSGLALLALLGVVLGFTVQLRAALKATRDQRDRAERDRAVAQAVNAFLQNDLLGQADIGNQPLPAGQGERNPKITVRDLLDRAATGLEGKFPDHAEVEAAIRQTIGDAYRALGEYDQAEQQMDRALAWRRRHLGADHPDTLQSLDSLAVLYRSRGWYDQAEPLCKEALAGRRRQLGADHPDTLRSLNNLAALYRSWGRYGAADPRSGCRGAAQVRPGPPRHANRHPQHRRHV